MAVLDTHSTVKKFIKFGFTEEQAEAVVDAINGQNRELATKSDIELLENKLNFSLKEVGTELVFNIKSLENKLSSKINDLENKFDSKTSSLNKDISWLKTISMATFTAVFGAAVAIVFKIFG